jgi:hypothetical protein
MDIPKVMLKAMIDAVIDAQESLDQPTSEAS